MLRLYGATIIDSPADQGSNGAVKLALELAEREPRYFMPFQYANPANPRAHYEGTGAEIAEALDRVDVLVAGLGTGGTLMGTGERLRESWPDVVVAAAEPLPGDPVMGLRSLDDGYVPPILDVSTSAASQKSALRYFQPASASTQTTTPSSSSAASVRATCTTAPAETPAKIPSRSRSARTARTDSSFETSTFRSSFETSRIGGT